MAKAAIEGGEAGGGLERVGPGATVVTIVCDSGLRYLSTDVYRRA